MVVQLVQDDEQRTILKHAIEDCVSNLGEEIVKTEKHDFNVPLKKQQEALRSIVALLWQSVQGSRHDSRDPETMCLLLLKG
jgi:hypothetical protein